MLAADAMDEQKKTDLCAEVVSLVRAEINDNTKDGANASSSYSAEEFEWMQQVAANLENILPASPQSECAQAKIEEEHLRVTTEIGREKEEREREAEKLISQIMGDMGQLSPQRQHR